MLPICRRDGQIINVHAATHEEFQAFVDAAGIPVDDGGVKEWYIDDRCAIINKALADGRVLPFVTPENQSENNQKNDCLAIVEVAQEAGVLVSWNVTAPPNTTLYVEPK